MAMLPPGGKQIVVGGVVLFVAGNVVNFFRKRFLRRRGVDWEDRGFLARVVPALIGISAIFGGIVVAEVRNLEQG